MGIMLQRINNRAEGYLCYISCMKGVILKLVMHFSRNIWPHHQSMCSYQTVIKYFPLIVVKIDLIIFTQPQFLQSLVI